MYQLFHIIHHHDYAYPIKSDNHEDTLHHQKRLTAEPVASNFTLYFAFFSHEIFGIHTAAAMLPVHVVDVLHMYLFVFN